MKRQQKTLLALAFLAAAILVLAVVYVQRSGPGESSVSRKAALSPWGQIALCVIIVGFILLGLLALYLKRCTERPHAPLHRIFSDEGGTAAFELLLALPCISLILAMMLQATLIWNANMVVHYAGFATTRAAITIISSDVVGIDKFLDIPIHEKPYMVNDPPPLDPDEFLEEPSVKLARIRRAAVMALIPISDELPAGNNDNRDQEIDTDFVAKGIATALGNGQGQSNAPWVKHVARQFAYADYFTETSVRRPDHWLHGEAVMNATCPWQASSRGDWVVGTGYSRVYFCPNHPMGLRDYAWYEPIEVTLVYPYTLEVPWVGSLLSKASSHYNESDVSVQSMQLPGSGRTVYYIQIKVVTQL